MIYLFNSSTLEYICKILSFRFGKNIKVDPSIGTRYRYMFHLHDETLDELLDMLTSINQYSMNIWIRILYLFLINDLIF